MVRRNRMVCSGNSRGVFFIQHVNQPFYGSFRVGQILFPEGCGEQEGIDGSFAVRPVLVFLNKKFS